MIGEEEETWEIFSLIIGQIPLEKRVETLSLASRLHIIF